MMTKWTLPGYVEAKYDDEMDFAKMHWSKA